jgi:microcystin degradation protein MlrC
MNQFRVLIAGLFHETHTFLEGTTPWEAFDVWCDNDLMSLRGQASPIGGVLDYAHHHDWNVVPSVFATAVPSATVQDIAFEQFWKLFNTYSADPIQQGIDAIYLVLHGAFVSKSIHDVEGEFLKRIRSLAGAKHLPIFGVYDLHANFSQSMAENADCLIAYRENPHSDAKQAAVRAAERLQQYHDTGLRPRQYMIQSPIIWPPTGTASADEPMRALLKFARELEATHTDFWGVNVNAGFAFSDTRDTGVSFTISTCGDEATAINSLRQLSQLAIEHAYQGNVIESVLGDVLAAVKGRGGLGQMGLTVIAEPSDNIGGGAPGDGTGLLRGLLEQLIDNAAVCLWDPVAVKKLQSYQPNARIKIALGGRGSQLSAGPLEVECVLISLCDGRFELEDKNSHLASMSGDHFDMGDCAVIRCGGVTILLTSRRTPPMDLGQWRHVGIEPESLSVIGVKAAVAHRKAYDPIAKFHAWIDTAGPCQSRLASFPYKHVRRPIYPLDEDCLNF